MELCECLRNQITERRYKMMVFEYQQFKQDDPWSWVQDYGIYCLGRFTALEYDMRKVHERFLFFIKFQNNTKEGYGIQNTNGKKGMHALNTNDSEYDTRAN
jgi:hypothetical protein